jgi:hypothetical protein
MMWATAMALICIGAVGFYVRFLLALCADCKARWICYLVRLEPETVGYTVQETRAEQRLLPRAA